jgi:hypothetical protein
MKGKVLGEKGITVFRVVVISFVLAAVAIGSTMCAPSQPTEAPPPPTEVVAEVPEEDMR